MDRRDAGTAGREGVARRVESAVDDNDVVVFLADGDGTGESDCRFCRRALSLVARHREEFASVDVSPAPEAYRRVLAARTGWVTFPQVFVEGTFVGDADVLATMEDRGTLSSTLATG